MPTSKRICVIFIYSDYFFFLVSFSLSGNTFSAQVVKALGLTREAKQFSQFMEGERAQITGA